MGDISSHPPPPLHAKGGPGGGARAGSSQGWGDPSSDPTQPGHRDPRDPHNGLGWDGQVASASHCVTPGQATSLFSSRTSWKSLSGQDLRLGPELGSLLRGGLRFLFSPESRRQGAWWVPGAHPELAATLSPALVPSRQTQDPSPEPPALLLSDPRFLTSDKAPHRPLLGFHCLQPG